MGSPIFVSNLLRHSVILPSQSSDDDQRPIKPLSDAELDTICHILQRPIRLVSGETLDSTRRAEMETRVLLRTRTLSAQMMKRDLTIGDREMEFNKAESSDSDGTNKAGNDEVVTNHSARFEKTHHLNQSASRNPIENKLWEFKRLRAGFT